MASSSPRIDLSSPDAIAAATFTSSRRGYDPDEVQTALRALAGEVGRARDEIARLKVELASRPTASGQIDEATIAAALGEEAAHVLTAAHNAAVQMRSRAEDASARLLRDASEEAARVREAAELDAAHRRREAADAAAAEVEDAKAEGRQMVLEARAVRERMLADLARRKEAARQQFDLVLDAHERVLRALGAARHLVDDASNELSAALPELQRPGLDDTQPVPVIVPDAPVSTPDPAASSPILTEHIFDHEAEAADDIDEPIAADTEHVARDHEAPSPTAASTDLVATVHLGEMPGRPVVLDRDAEDADRVDLDRVVLGRADADRVDAGEHPSAGSASSPPSRRLTLVVSSPEATPDEIPVEDSQPEPAVDAIELVEGAEQALVDEHEDLVVEPVDDLDDADRDPAPSAEPGPSVDDLFARIRAARAEAVSHANGVLAQPSSPVLVEATVRRIDEASEPAQLERAASPSLVPVGAEPDRPTPADPDAAARAVEARAILLDPLILQAGRRLKRTLADEQNEVLDRLRRGPGVPPIDALLGDAAAHMHRYRDAIADELATAARAGAQALGGTARDARKVEGAVADEISGEFVTPLRHRLHDAVAEAGGDPEAASDRLRAAYREWKVQRLDAVAAHLMRVAYGRGGFAALAPGASVCWAVDPGAPPCPDADDNVLGGAVAAGTAFPTGHLHAPAYPGCRCVLVATHR